MLLEEFRKNQRFKRPSNDICKEVFMFNTIIVLFIVGLIVGLCISQQDATERELEFRIRTYDLLNGINL